MFLHVGNDILVNIKDIIGIFDMENTTYQDWEEIFFHRLKKKILL